MGTELEEGEARQAGGGELISGGKPETPGRLVSAVAPKTRVLPVLGCLAVGSHTGGLTSLSPFVKVVGSCRPPGYSVGKRKGGRAPRGGWQKRLGVRRPRSPPSVTGSIVLPEWLPVCVNWGWGDN